MSKKLDFGILGLRTLTFRLVDSFKESWRLFEDYLGAAEFLRILRLPEMPTGFSGGFFAALLLFWWPFRQFDVESPAKILQNTAESYKILQNPTKSFKNPPESSRILQNPVISRDSPIFSEELSEELSGRFHSLFFMGKGWGMLWDSSSQRKSDQRRQRDNLNPIRCCLPPPDILERNQETIFETHTQSNHNKK